VTKHVSIILATYNEADQIQEVLRRTIEALGERLKEIIVVDDNSPDGTANCVRDLNDPRIRLIVRSEKFNLQHRNIKPRLASAIAHGIELSSGNVIGWFDADLSHPPELIKALLNEIDNGVAIAIASRFVPGGADKRSPLIVTCSYLINLFARLILLSPIKDQTSGFALVKSEVFDHISLSPIGHGEYFIEFLYEARRSNFSIQEVGYSFRERNRGQSKTYINLTQYLVYGLIYSARVIAIRFGLHQSRMTTHKSR